MVVTGQTVGTLAVMVPRRWNAGDVIDGTKTGTKATLDAGFRVNPELLVVDEVLVVVAADDVGVCIGNGTLDEFLDARLAVLDDFADVDHPFFGGLFLLLLPFGCV